MIACLFKHLRALIIIPMFFRHLFRYICNIFLPLHYCDVHNGRDGVSIHKPHDCLLNRLFRRRLKKTSKFHVTGLCAQMVSDAENISLWWHHHVISWSVISPRNSVLLSRWMWSLSVCIFMLVSFFDGKTWMYIWYKFGDSSQSL